jgi:hypothetical protein
LKSGTRQERAPSFLARLRLVRVLPTPAAVYQRIDMAGYKLLIDERVHLNIKIEI